MGFFVVGIILFLFGCDASASRTSGAASSTVIDSSNARTDTALTLIDDSRKPVRLSRPARRVISLVPSGTETIVALGARGRLVGRTSYDHDTTLAHLPLVGGSLDPNLETIVSLRPDLVLVWSSEQRSALRQKLETAGVATLALSLQDTTDVYRALSLVGRALGLDAQADTLLSTIHASLQDTRALAQQRPRRRVFYVVYNDPPMTTGPATFIGQVLDLIGADNVFADVTTNWPTVEIEELVRRDPDVIVLPIGEMPVRTLTRLRHEPGWRELRAVRNDCVVQIDADLANRPGPRVAQAAHAFFQLIHDRPCTSGASPAPAPTR